ncbi:MAG: formimidoylglutamase [Cyclobacteriaceae bacterium]
MAHYSKPDQNIWKGRFSLDSHYIYQKVDFADLSKPEPILGEEKIAFLGYQCDEGVRRNQGREGAKDAPDIIRTALSTFANHLSDTTTLIDCGNVSCDDQDMEQAHALISDKVKVLLNQNCLPILFGGGHDLAYAHFRGIKNHLPGTSKIGVINLDAHFDLRQVEGRGNSGTPFNQIAGETEEFNYLCLGIQPQANHKGLYATADQLGVQYLEMDAFQQANWTQISGLIENFISGVDHIYLTVDMDGFSSAYAPGVSAPSPLGFEPNIVRNTLSLIRASKKLISADIVEFNPKFDQDGRTAKLAAWVAYELIS